MLTLGSLFSGIGGLELGVEAATGARVLWQVERDAWCREVLAKHWPDAVRYDDVCTVNGLPRVDIICGGFPCQDVSLAGKRAGFSGERSSLWREYRRIIADVRPRFVFVENVPGLLTADGGWAFGEVLGDLAALGFDATWDVFRASDVGAPHRRERVFLLAYRVGGGRDGFAHGACRDILDGPTTRREEGADRVTDGSQIRPLAYAEQREGGERHDADLLGGWSRHTEQTRVGGGSRAVAHSSRVGEREPADEGVAVAARGRARVEPRRGGESQLADAERGRRSPTRKLGERGNRPEDGRGRTADKPIDDSAGRALAGVGLPADGLPRRLDDHRWPAGRGEAQHPGEPPRTASGVAMRAAQLKALGNAVVPQCAALAWRVLSARALAGAA